MDWAGELHNTFCWKLFSQCGRQSLFHSAMCRRAGHCTPVPGFSSNFQNNWISLLLFWRGRRKIFFFLPWHKRLRKLWKRRPESREVLLWPPQAWNFLSNGGKVILRYWEPTCPLPQQLCWHLFLWVKIRGEKKEANNRVEFTSSAPFLDNCLFIPSLSLCYLPSSAGFKK